MQETLKYPLHAADVELQIIRAAHEDQQGAPSAILAWLRLRGLKRDKLRLGRG